MSTTPDVRAIADLAVTATYEAGKAAMAGFGDTSAAERKGDQHDVVTEHDRRAESLIRERITAAYPGSSILGEEDGQEGHGRLKWFIDPIDGTKNFAAGIPFFCVSVGVTYDDQLIAAATYDPVRDEMFHAHPGSAMLNGIPISSEGGKHRADAVLLMDAPNEGPEKSTEQESILSRCLTEFGTVRRLGSCALELAYVASGRADVQVGLAAFPWDIAAGILLVTESGGQFHTPLSQRGSDNRPWESKRFVAHAAQFAFSGSPVLEKVLAASR